MTPQPGTDLYFEMSTMSQPGVGVAPSSSSRSVFAVGNWRKAERVCSPSFCSSCANTPALCRVVHEARARDPTWSRRAQVSRAGPPRLQLAAVDVFSRLWLSVARSVPHSGF